MKTRFFIVVILFCTVSFSNSYSQKIKSVPARIEYITLVNGTEDRDRGKIILETAGDVAKITTQTMGKTLIPEAPTETGYLDYKEKRAVQLAEFQDGKKISAVTPFDKMPQFEITDQQDTVAGYLCRKAKAVVFSNTIEIWFTVELGIKGAPSLGYAMDNVLILKILRNNNFEIRAVSVERNQKTEPLPMLPADIGQTLETQDYRQVLASAYIKKVKVFTDEQISWGNPASNPANHDSAGATYRFAGGTVILRKVILPEVPSDASVFVNLTQFSNGDAYDRTGSVFLVPVNAKHSFLNCFFDGLNTLPAYQAKNGKSYQGIIKTEDFNPVVELMRFFTPFGIRQYNEKVKITGYNWFDSVTYKQDITELLPLLKGEQWIGIYLGNYDAGGHKVSLNIDFHLNHKEVQEMPVEKPFWISLFNTTNIMEMAGQEYGTLFGTDTLTVWLDIPERATGLKLRYISTGHGGWENGDEFIPKENVILIDGKEIFSYTPWRADCATYRLYNPASGNFWNGLSSSDYSRSGWCPGTATNPVYIPLENLSPGKHKFQIFIPMGAPEGSSFSSWNISGIVLGKQK